MAFIDDLKNKYREGSMLMRLIYINIAVFVVLHIIGLVSVLSGHGAVDSFSWIELSSIPQEVLYRPWTVITYAFAHYEILHILFNMLWLYWLGRIFMEYFTSKQLVGLYLLGAVGGAALYLLMYTFVPALSGHNYMLGASASVMAIVVGIAAYSPDYKIGLLFIGEISLKWVAIVAVMIDLLSLDSMTNVGGHIAHLGGAGVGLLYALMMRRGHDITAPLNSLIDKLVSLFARRDKQGPGSPVGGRAYRRAAGNTSAGADSHQQSPRAAEEELDRVLAKIKRSGYTALTEEERAMLFSFSKKDKK